MSRLGAIILRLLGRLFLGTALGVVLLLLTILILSGIYKDPCDDDGIAVHSPACDALYGGG